MALCMCVCVCVRVRACVRACVSVPHPTLVFDTTIGPRPNLARIMRIALGIIGI